MNAERFLRQVERAGVRVDLSEVYDRPVRGLLTTSNQKVAKGEGQGWLTAILHLAPARASGFQLCASATAGCERACLNTAGRGGIFRRGERDNAIQRCRRRRSHWFIARRGEFLARLDREVAAHARKARKKGFQPSVRLNGTSDVKWENILFEDGRTIFERHPDVVFYDYTKHPQRDVSDIPNYSLTFSLAESNDSDAEQVIERGDNVAVVFHDVPESFMGRPVINGDESDLRFLDPKGVIVGLKAKGKARQDTSGFVR